MAADNLMRMKLGKSVTEDDQRYLKSMHGSTKNFQDINTTPHASEPDGIIVIKE